MSELQIAKVAKMSFKIKCTSLVIKEITKSTKFVFVGGGKHNKSD